MTHSCPTAFMTPTFVDPVLLKQLLLSFIGSPCTFRVYRIDFFGLLVFTKNILYKMIHF